MPDFEELGKELERRGKTGALKSLAESDDGQRVARSLDAAAVARAARSGDSAALASLLRGVLSSPEGQRLARSVEELMEK